MNSLNNLAGLFCVGLSGTILNDEDRRILDRGVGGIVLFSRNVDRPDQVAALIESARKHAGEQLLACVDQEGGRVARFEEGFNRVPTMRELGVAMAGNGRQGALGFEVGQCLGQDLREVGIDMNFAPVLDVDTNPDNPVIGDRSIGRDPGQVADIGCQLIEGLMSQGIIACGKHFPGHGDTAQDSHFDLPHLAHSMDRMEEVELFPFKEVIKRLKDKDPGGLAMMTAHVVFEAIDPAWPGTLCPEVLTGLLREKLGFGGMCVSDCTEMKAIADGDAWGGTIGASVRAIQSGVDFVLVCHTHEVMHGALDAVESAAREGRISAERLEQAFDYLAAARLFRARQKGRDEISFRPSSTFEAFVKSARSAGQDPTWETVGNS